MSYVPITSSNYSRVHADWIQLPDSGPPLRSQSVPRNGLPAAHTLPEPNAAEHDSLLDANPTNGSRALIGTTTVQHGDGNKYAKQHTEKTSKQMAGEWRPYSLRPAFLGSMALISIALAIALAALCWYSIKHNGLQEDRDTPGLLAARRYLPTVLAVFFTQALVIIANDIKRTEPFARLAHSEQPEIEHTLLFTPKAWWSTIREGLVRKRNSGKINWVLVLSSMTTGISILALSTLSSSLLASEQVILRSNVSMKRFNPFPITIKPRRQANFHATSGFLFNASTSMWVSDDYVVSPFGTTDLHNHPDFLPEGTWKMETKVLQMESQCRKMHFGKFTTLNTSAVIELYHPPGAHVVYNSASPKVYESGWVTQNNSRMYSGFTLDSDDGCHIQVVASLASRQDHRIVEYGGVFWTNLSSSYITYNQWAEGRGSPVFSRSTEWSPMDAGLMLDFSNECMGHSLLMVTTPWAPDRKRTMTTEGFQVRAELCTSQYFEAMTNVTASVTSDVRQISMDKDKLRGARSEISNDLLDLDMIEQLTYGRAGLDYVDLARTLSSNWAYEGLSEALAALYSFDNDAMVHNNTFAEEGARLHKRFFGELVLSAMTEQRPADLKAFTAQRTQVEQRIVVVIEAAVTLSVLLLLLSCYLLFLYLTQSSKRRPLNLDSDPSTSFGIGAYMQRNSSLRRLIETAQHMPSLTREPQLAESTEYARYQADKTPHVTVKGYTGTIWML